MKTTRAFHALAVAAALVASPLAALAAKAPDWMQAAAEIPLGKYLRGTPAAILSNEESVDIETDGTLTRRVRIVTRILTNEGRDYAVGSTYYDKSSDKLSSIGAWVIHPSGKVERFKRNDAVEIAAFGGWLELYGERWSATIDGSEGITPGCVFGFEVVKKERRVFSQNRFFFQANIPTERSSFSVRVPRGWHVEGRVFNSDSVNAVDNGGRLTWTLSGLPEIPDEPMSPSRYDWGPWLAVDYRHPDDMRGDKMSWSYDSWQAVSEQLTQLHEPAIAPDESIRARAAEIAGGATSRMEKIRAICAFVQGVHYVSINMNIGTGGGYIPRPASRVLACGYGDCKDKSALLHALLAAQGIEAHLVFVFSGDSERVEESWPSPSQFNHCIVAIRVDDSMAGPAVVDGGPLGRLLLFDPTNQYAPLGILPWEDQGGSALLIAGAKGRLIQLPAALPGENHVERRIHARLDRTGALAGTISESFKGNSSVSPRRELRERSPTSYRELIERWLGRTMPGARTKRVDPVDDFDGASVKLDVEFETPAHGRLMGDRLMIFKPVLVVPRNAEILTPRERRSPVEFEARSLDEAAEFELPPGFKVDDMIAPVDIESPFGSYQANGRIEDGTKLVFVRRYTLRNAVVPASDYAVVRDFFEKVIEAEQSPIVLSRE